MNTRYTGCLATALTRKGLRLKRPHPPIAMTLRNHLSISRLFGLVSIMGEHSRDMEKTETKKKFARGTKTERMRTFLEFPGKIDDFDSNEFVTPSASLLFG